MSELHAQAGNELWINMIYCPFTRQWEQVKSYLPESKELLKVIEYKNVAFGVRSAPNAAASPKKSTF